MSNLNKIAEDKAKEYTKWITDKYVDKDDMQRGYRGGYLSGHKDGVKEAIEWMREHFLVLGASDYTTEQLYELFLKQQP